MNKNNTDKDSIIKSLGAVLLGIIVLALVYNVFFSPQQSYRGFGYNMYMGHGGMQMGTGMMGTMGTGFNFNLGNILGGILVILVKLLSISLVVGLVVGLWVMIKDYLFADGDNPFASLTQAFTKNKMNCPKCGSNVDTKWDFCPDCGQELTKQNKPQANTQNTGNQYSQT